MEARAAVADIAGEALGEDHDLAVLAALAKAEPETFGDDRELARKIGEWAPDGRFGWVFGVAEEPVVDFRSDVTALDLTELVLCTAGAAGLYLAGHTDDDVKRETRYPLLPGAIPEFNRHEFSRPMRRAACTAPLKVFAYIAPYHGGPARITSTNGAGDGALAALLHDMSANRYHRASVPNSSKHVREFLTYSSMSQVCRYANRVSYQVLAQSAPRLTRGLPEREEGLDDEAYWAR